MNSNWEVRVDGKVVDSAHVEAVRHAAWRMMDSARDNPLPTTKPATLGASKQFYSQTWCPTDFVPSKTALEKRKEYLQWRKQLEAEAEAEVRAGDKAYKKERKRLQKGGAPKDDMGKSLW